MQAMFEWRHIEATRVTSTFHDFRRQLSSVEESSLTPRFLDDHCKYAVTLRNPGKYMYPNGTLKHVSQLALILAYT
jgi:hypothetical protein